MYQIESICVPIHSKIFTFLLLVQQSQQYIYISGAETGLVLLVPGTTNNSVNVIQNGLKIIH